MRPAKAKRASTKSLMKSLRNDADAIAVLRGRMNDDGSWSVEWEGLHWVEDEHVGSSGMPTRFMSAASKDLMLYAANDTAELSLGSLGASLGMAFVKAVTGKEEEH